MSDNGQQVPLIERLRRVPAAARVLEHTPNPLGYDTTSIPVGALCQEAAARIDELERENDALSMEASENLQRREKAESDFKELSISSNARVAEGLLARSAVALAAERERREAAEALLLELVAVVRGECPSLLDEDSGGDARTSLDIDAHFARYKKEPT